MGRSQAAQAFCNWGVWTHVQRRPNHSLEARVDRMFGKCLIERLCDTEINHFGNSPPVKLGDQNIAGLNIAMNDTFLMCVLNRLAHLDKQFQTFSNRQFVLITVFR